MYERLETGEIQVALVIDGTPNTLVLSAADVRKERTGIHAKITIGVDTMRVDSDTFNIGRREERTRLANAALKSPLIADLAPRIKTILDHELMNFLDGLWEFEIGKNTPERRGGGLSRTAPPWLLKPYLLQNAGTILFAAPGLGKSWTAYALAVMVDAGYDFFYEVQPHPVLVVNLERSAESVDIRLGDINAALRQPRERGLLRLDRRGRKFADVGDAVQRIVQSEGVQLVILDSLSRAGYGNLNENDDANRSMDALNALGCAWIALGHTARGDDTHVFGSQMFDAAADVTVQLLSEERIDQFSKVTLGIGLKGMKANDIRVPPLTVLAYEFDELGLTAIRKSRPGEFLTIENQSAALDVRGQVGAYLRAEGPSSATAIARDTGIARSTLSTLLNHAPEFHRERQGRSVVFSLTTDDVSSSTLHDTSSTPDVSSDHVSKGRQHQQVTETYPILHVSNDVSDVSSATGDPLWSDESSRIDSLQEMAP